MYNEALDFSNLDLELAHNPFQATVRLGLHEWTNEPLPIWVTDILKEADKVLLTGSRFICYPPVTETDIDILILVKDRIDFGENLPEDWSVCGTEYEDDVIGVYRNKQYNLLITDDKAYFYRWVMASEIAMSLNLQSKEKRKQLFIQVTNSERYIYGTEETK